MNLVNYFARVEIIEGSSVESTINELVLPFIDILVPDAKRQSLRFYYEVIRAVGPNNTHRTDGQFHIFLPTASSNEESTFKAQLENECRVWEKQGKIGGFVLGSMDGAEGMQFFGGERAKGLAIEVNSICSRSLLHYAKGVGSLEFIDNRTVKAMQITELLLSKSCRGLAASEVAALLLLRCEDFIAQTNSDFGLNFDIETLRPHANVVAEQYRAKSILGGVDANDSWADCLKSISDGLDAAFFDLDSVRSEAKKNVGLHEWVGRRLIHANFSRFYIAPPVELTLFVGYAELLNRGEIQWRK